MNIIFIKSTLLSIIVLIIGMLNVHECLGQKKIAVYAIQVNAKSSNSSGRVGYISVVPEKIINYFSNNPDFEVIDRKNQSLISKEMNLQKSESFIDGYIVDQGKAEGADLICSSLYDENEKHLIIKLYDVATGKVFCSKERKMKSGWLGLGLKSVEQEVTIMLHEISSTCFDESFPVVRVTKGKKGKAKEILVLVGYAQRVKLDYKFDIVQLVEESIGDKKITRKMKIGEAYIKNIEDENFSTLKITEGKKEIAQALEKGEKLECRLISGKH